MEKIFVISVISDDINTLVNQLKLRVKDVLTFDNLFEFRKHTEKEKPDVVLVADNLKEKKIEDLMKSIHALNVLDNTPIIGLVSCGEKAKGIEFLKNGVVDAIYPPLLIEELMIRLDMRFEEIQLRQSFTAGEFFFNEAQEKEQGRRTGIFKFFNNDNTEIGNMAIKNGRLVHATYGSLIKADAFLQLSSNSNLKFVFTDKDDIQNSSIDEGITGLLLEASKLKDEIKKQETEQFDEVKFLVIDSNRIARIMANRVLKKLGFLCKVTSTNEMTVRFMVNYAPQVIIIDYADGEFIMDMLWPDGRKDDDIPVIIYCDEDIKDINSMQIGKHKAIFALYKNQFHKEIKSILQTLKIL